MRVLEKQTLTIKDRNGKTQTEFGTFIPAEVSKNLIRNKETLKIDLKNPFQNLKTILNRQKPAKTTPEVQIHLKTTNVKNFKTKTALFLMFDVFEMSPILAITLLFRSYTHF